MIDKMMICILPSELAYGLDIFEPNEDAICICRKQSFSMNLREE
jgi:hypothetical protein